MRDYLILVGVQLKGLFGINRFFRQKGSGAGGLLIRVCLKNSLICNFGIFCAISASSTLDLALLSLRVSSLN